MIRPFIGNIADVFIFSRSPDDDAINCMHDMVWSGVFELIALGLA